MKNKEKILKHIEKRDTIYVAIVMLIINFVLTKIDILYSSDAIWNFQNIYKVYNGYEMYGDANIIITPFFFYIALALFKVFGATFATFSLYSVIINVSFLVVLYEIFKEFEIKKLYSFILVILLFAWETGLFFANNANYNLLALLWVLVSVLIRLKNYKRKIKFHGIIQGVLLFLVLFTKQNIGVFFLIGTTIYNIIKDDSKKEKMKSIIIEYCTIGFLGIIFLIYLHFSGTWDGFFFYTIQGMGEFSENERNITFFDSKSIGEMAVILLGIIFVAIGRKKEVFTKQQKEKIKILLCVSILLIGAMYPISNAYHVSLACFTGIITTIYIVKSVFIAEITISEKNKKRLIIVVLVYSIVQMTFLYQYLFSDTISIENRSHPFYGIRIDKEIYDNMEKVRSYIRKKQENNIDVIMIYEKSGLYMIPLKDNNGEFDCFNRGNLGATGTEGAIEKIKQMKNTEILILTNDEDVFWQEPEEVRTYIKENLEYAGQIEQFSIYKTK